MLAEHGIHYAAAAAATAELAIPTGPAETASPGSWWRKSRRRWWRTNPRNPPWAVAAGAAAESAAAQAARERSRFGTSHLLIAAVADPDSPGSQVLRPLDAEPSVVAAENARRLGARLRRR